MSFGFGFGDGIAIATLISDIISSLREAGGAKSEYQELVRELAGLNKALEHLDILQASSVSYSNLQSIRYAALSCRQPLEEFLHKIKRYERSLGFHSSPNSVVKATVDKLRWSFRKKDDIRRIQSYLSIHVSTINMLLAEHGIEKIDLAADKAESANFYIRERLEHIRSVLDFIKDKAAAQALAIVNAQSMLVELFRMISGEFKSSLASLAEMAAKVCITTQQIYNVVFEIRESLARIDTRWTFFAAPLSIEDSFGSKFPIPSEYDFTLVDTIIRHRLRHDKRLLGFKSGFYDLLQTKNSQNVIHRRELLLPGTEIKMKILTLLCYSTNVKCPLPTCTSGLTSPVPGGGWLCKGCGLWFDHVTTKLHKLERLLDAIDSLHTIEYPKLQADVYQPNTTNFTGNELSNNTVCGNTVTNFDNTIDHKNQESNIHEFPPKDDAVKFLNQVKNNSQDNYTSFLDIMKGFKYGEYDISTIIHLTSKLFADTPLLLSVFSIFLPPATRPIYTSESQAIRYPLLEDKNTVQCDTEGPILFNGLWLLDQVRIHKPDCYSSFLEIALGQREGKSEFPHAIRRTALLLADTPRMLYEVYRFMPSGYMLYCEQPLTSSSENTNECVYKTDNQIESVLEAKEVFELEMTESRYNTRSTKKRKREGGGKRDRRFTERSPRKRIRERRRT